MEIQPTLAAFEAAGLQIKFKEMEKGEKRYSVNLLDGSAWILTIAGETGGWQNAHYHQGWLETYAVHSGEIAVAECAADNTEFCLNIYQAGMGFCLPPGIKHNIYMPAGAIIHTVKAGKPIGNPDKKGNDWWPAQTLDTWTKLHTSLEEIKRNIEC